MRIILLSAMVMLAVLPLSAQSNVQEKSKKVHQFTVSRDYDLSAEQIWAIVGEDYGAIAKSHPKIISSEYINGSFKAAEGAERVCTFNEKGTRFVQEKIKNFDAENMTFENVIFHSDKFPVDPDYTIGVYKVEDLGNGKSRFTFEMTYRTKPAFMGGMAKGKFKGLIEDYMIAVEHYVKTGQAVTRDNFKEVKKLYES